MKCWKEKKKWNEMIENFYGDFHLTVENVIGTAQSALGERNLGVDPITGKNVFVRIGPFGYHGSTWGK